MSLRRLRYAFVGVALACCGAYVFVYLSRWEWHRAMVAGLLFVAAEIGLATSVVLERLGRIERRLIESSEKADSDDEAVRTARARISEAAPEPRVGFGWLTEDVNRMPVFVPILLGAGVALSGLAWVLERLARVTAGPMLEQELAVRLAPLTLAPGTLGQPLGPPAEVGRRSRRSLHVGIAALAVLAAAAGTDALGDATQTRPDPYVRGSASRVVLSVHERSSRDALRVAESLWGACAAQLGSRYRVLGMVQSGSNRVEVTVGPSIGKYGERRLRGCVGDGTSERIKAAVLSVATLPAP